jgi:hypothetical protein
VQIDEVVDVGASGQRNQPESAEGEEEDAEGAPRRVIPLGSKHLLKVCVTDGLQHAVGLDLHGALAAAYHTHLSRLAANGDRPSLQSFFAGGKVCNDWQQVWDSYIASHERVFVVCFIDRGEQRAGAQRGADTDRGLREVYLWVCGAATGAVHQQDCSGPSRAHHHKRRYWGRCG